MTSLKRYLLTIIILISCLCLQAQTKKTVVESFQKRLKDKIKGIWSDGSSENASFVIKTDSIYYVDQFTSYKYELIENTIKIKYPDWIFVAKVSFLKDTLIMDSEENGISKFWKFKK